MDLQNVKIHESVNFASKSTFRSGLNTEIVAFDGTDLKTIVTPEVMEMDSIAESILISYMKSDSLLDHSIIIEYDDADSTFYFYYDSGILIGVVKPIADGNYEFSAQIPEDDSTNTVLGFWDTFNDCWNVSMADGYGAAAGAGAAFGCQFCAYGAGAIVGGVTLGCLAAAYELN